MARAYNLGPRPSQLFLVWAEGVPLPIWVAWKANNDLLWIHAGLARDLLPRTSGPHRIDSSPPTIESIERDFRAAMNLPTHTLRVHDISDRFGYYHPRIHRPEIRETGIA